MNNLKIKNMNNLKINSKFSPLFNDIHKSNFYQVYGGRSGGKTFAVIMAEFK